MTLWFFKLCIKSCFFCPVKLTCSQKCDRENGIMPWPILVWMLLKTLKIKCNLRDFDYDIVKKSFFLEINTSSLEGTFWKVLTQMKYWQGYHIPTRYPKIGNVYFIHDVDHFFWSEGISCSCQKVCNITDGKYWIVGTINNWKCVW